MKTVDILNEANVAAKIAKDPKTAKMLGIAWRHDATLPRTLVAKLGPRASDEQIVHAWSKLLDDTLRTNNYGDLSADGRFDDWLTRLYINGAADYEDINGEGGDALGAWAALNKRGLLRPADQDFNKFRSIRQLQRIRNDRSYRNELDRIKDAEHIEKMKREKKDVVIVDNDRYYVVVPLNYGACYTFGNAAGYKPNFCTNSSSGLRWFNNYAPDGIIVSITDKHNQDVADGKWQFHAATNQIVNGDQENRHDRQGNDEKFSKLFPGLMTEIIHGIQSHADEIKAGSTELTRGGYDIAKEIDAIKSKYPLSVASKVKADEPEAEPEEPTAEPQAHHAEPEAHHHAAAAHDDQDGPGRYSVTHTPTNRTAIIPANDRADLMRKLNQRYPDYPDTDYNITKQPNEA